MKLLVYLLCIFSKYGLKYLYRIFFVNVIQYTVFAIYFSLNLFFSYTVYAVYPNGTFKLQSKRARICYMFYIAMKSIMYFCLNFKI